MRMSKRARLDSATAVSISSFERPRKSAALVGLAATTTDAARRDDEGARAEAPLVEGARAARIVFFRRSRKRKGNARGKKNVSV